MISEKVIRCDAGDTLIVGMGNDMRKDDQIGLVVDAVHLCLRRQVKKLKLVFGRREEKGEQMEVENAVATLIECVRDDLNLEIRVCVNEDEIQLETRPFNEGQDLRITRWMSKLSEEKHIPKAISDLEAAINNPLFTWYRGVTGNRWSGRVGGLEVCSVGMDGTNGNLKVGNPGKHQDGPVRKIFHEILAKNKMAEGPFSDQEYGKVASVILDVVRSRENGKLQNLQREHLFESRVLAGALNIITREGRLRPVVDKHPFQFPALWPSSKQPRFIDAMMRLEDTPYVVELKVGSPGQGFRHAITQAFLYREYIRRAEKVHPWFSERRLKPEKCKAIVAFPELTKDKKRQRLLFHLIELGEAFDVNIVEIENFGFNYSI